MCIGYDPFTWADNFKSEEEYMEDLENDKKRINNGGTNAPDIEQRQSA